jgi:hypothetical protein
LLFVRFYSETDQNCCIPELDPEMKKVFLILVFGGFLGWFYFSSSNNIGGSGIKTEEFVDTVSFSLKKGDVLVRPNFDWLPGSYPINAGRMFGHAAIVTEDVSGKSVDEVLAKASIIEAVVFDQKTRSFIFDKKEQVRETKAIISFGPRFKGIRYRLRMNLTDQQTDNLLQFLKNQLDGRYSVFTVKKFADPDPEKKVVLRNSNWHCASIVWQAFYQVTGVDIDENEGFVVYPSDIIASKYFDLPDGRTRF